ncbi:hypothetical protein L227DRAFT_330113 [Lentinus tigrinus ALCF2SS1-6]|uniref:DUF6533 domain-containing protein n=1 Tax=Lentinus tigrinus ALCF2SS1-6 TaxID=1328759 RepID=A0A5C2SLI8_9APHY|nr:hypothetical protein L227DRAFT_330113 [Lentinus tigrinus ALCF2SS1-6]
MVSLPNFPTALNYAESDQALVQLLKYAGMASSTYLVVDYAETIDDEVTLIWPSRWNMMKLIFLVNRYSPFFDHAITVSGMLWITDPHRCIFNWMFSITILIIRTIALRDFNKRVIMTMILLAAIMLIPTLSVMYIYVRSLTTNYPSEKTLKAVGCIPSIADQVGWVFYVTTLISETMVILLTLLKPYRSYVRGHRMLLLMHTMYRDGTLFYLIILGFSIANICCMFAAPVAAMPLLQEVLRAVHSTLCSRVLINLRRVAAQRSELDDFSASAFQLSETNTAHTLYFG